MLYFGPYELRPGNEPMTTTPVGAECLLCKETIKPNDAGQISAAGRVIHFECLTRALVGSTAHQQYQCSCYGGPEPENDGVSYRQGAIEATDLFRRTQVLARERESGRYPTADAFWADPGDRHRDFS